MFCPSCAHNNPDGASRCAACGTMLPTPPDAAAPYAPAPPSPGAYGYPPPMAYMPVRRGTSGMAIAGFVCSFFCGVLGLIFSIIGYNETKKSGGTIDGNGLALAGIIISIVSMVVGVLIAVRSPF